MPECKLTSRASANLLVDVNGGKQQNVAAKLDQFWHDVSGAPLSDVQLHAVCIIRPAGLLARLRSFGTNGQLALFVHGTQ
jgi:hypothetical protein